MSFYSLPTGKLYKKEEKKKLKIFPAGYVSRFYRNLADNVDNLSTQLIHQKNLLLAQIKSSSLPDQQAALTHLLINVSVEFGLFARGKRHASIIGSLKRPKMISR